MMSAIYAISRDDYATDEEYAQAIQQELAVEDDYTEKKVMYSMWLLASHQVMLTLNERTDDPV
ncbi:hypothetical protein, partial [Yersinia pekkanenii]|uniref:hypothetical protein n=1 Tax=Yersinia pekkanenii TaxID=1288385 RepID=UPI001427CEB8